MHDRFRKRQRVGHADARLRRQIATEAARRLLPRFEPDPDAPALVGASPRDYEAAKRQAVAVLGQRVRPGDLPTDEEVRAQVLALRNATHPQETGDEHPEPPPAGRMSEALDRFELFKIRLEPLQEIKLNPRWHPEGDALYHALQVFERARAVRPYDEEFLLAALLHDAGRALDPERPIAAALVGLEGAITERTAWLIAHLPDLLPRAGRPPAPRLLQELRRSPWYDDLMLLAELDQAGRERGAAVPTVDEALALLRDLEAETMPEGDDRPPPDADEG